MTLQHHFIRLCYLLLVCLVLVHADEEMNVDGTTVTDFSKELMVEQARSRSLEDRLKESSAHGTMLEGQLKESSAHESELKGKLKESSAYGAELAQQLAVLKGKIDTMSKSAASLKEELAQKIASDVQCASSLKQCLSAEPPVPNCDISMCQAAAFSTLREKTFQIYVAYLGAATKASHEAIAWYRTEFYPKGSSVLQSASISLSHAASDFYKKLGVAYQVFFCIFPTI